MPWRDWQFWAVTVLALGCAWVVLRPILPRRRRPPRRGGRVQLTVRGERVR